MDTPEFKFQDFLPSRFKTWLEFYYLIMYETEKAGYVITDEEIIKFSDYTDFKEREFIRKTYDIDAKFVFEFPLTLIKARAFDEIVKKIPAYETTQKLREAALQSYRGNDELICFFEGILDVAKKRRR